MKRLTCHQNTVVSPVTTVVNRTGTQFLNPGRCTSVIWLIASGILLSLVGCNMQGRDEVEEGETIGGRQVSFRVRSDFAAGLNADAGWAGALNENVTVQTDQPFRIRFELEGSPEETGDRRYRLQYRRNGGPWEPVDARDFPYPEDASPRVSIVSAGAYENGTEAADLLTGSENDYAGGAGVSLAAVTPVWSGGNVHGEWEWPVVIRRFADGAVTNDEGDTFEFRMVEEGGNLLESYVNPVLTLSVPPRHLGGTFVETPGRIGPWEASNGDLYFIMEPTETDNVMMMVKSTDRGATWEEVDGANRPSADDLEGLAADMSGGTIHILHQTSDEVWHHSFRTSDHPSSPDSWDIRDELVATPAEPPTQVASIAVRPDDSIVGVYGGPEKIHFKIRSPDGTWGAETVVDAGVPPNLSGPQVVPGEGNVVHLAYNGYDGTGWYRRIQPDGTLTSREQVATGLGTTEYDAGSILPLVFIPETNTVVVIYRLATGKLWERRSVAHGPLSDPVQVSERNVVQNAVDSDQTGADAIANGTTVHVLFIEEESGSIYHTRSDEAGTWQAPTPAVEGIQAQWLRGRRLTSGQGPSVYGYVYDAGSNGGSGMNKYAEVPLSGM